MIINICHNLFKTSKLQVIINQFYYTIPQNSTILVALMCLILFTALVIFGIRLYLNDLYVSIPDRLLVTCALAQILHDIPVEALIADGNIWEASPYLKVSWTFLD